MRRQGRSSKGIAQTPRRQAVDSTARPPDGRGWAVWGLLLMAVVVIAYVPAIRGGYVWDDDSYVTGNAHLRTVDGLGKIWFQPNASPQYYPLVFTSFWIEFHLWELHPLGYHLINVFLHGFSAVLLWLVLRRLSVPGAWLAACLFALHPVHVESVAWITERKNVLSGVCYLSALLMYLRASALDGQPTRNSTWWRRYIVCLLLFMAALLSKSVTCSLPAVLLLILWWKKARLTVRDLLPLVPMLAVGLAMGLQTIHTEKHHVGASGEEWSLSLVEHLLLAGRIVWFYVGKLAVPTNLTFIYPRWTIDAGIWWQYLFPLGLVAVVAALWTLRQRIGKAPLVAVLIFVGTLTPALGFFNVFPMRFSYVADHFQYLASIGPITLAAVVLVRWLRGQSVLTGRPSSARPATSLGTKALAVFPGVVLVPLAVLTWRQGRIYENIETLWRDTIAKNPTAWIAENNLAHVLINEQKYAEAVPHLYAALKYNPQYPEALFSLCGALSEMSPPGDDRLAEAVTRCQDGLALRPGTALGHNNLCRALSKQGRHDAAVAHCQEAIRLRPQWAQSQTDLGLAFWRAKSFNEALRHLKEAVRLAPDNPQAHFNLAVALDRLGDINGSIQELTIAVQLRPDFEKAKNILARLIARASQSP